MVARPGELYKRKRGYRHPPADGSPSMDPRVKSMLPGKKLRVGAVSYLNSKPLIECLPASLPPHSHLSLDLPSRLADQLAGDQIDVGLIPVIEYFRHQTPASAAHGESLPTSGETYRMVSDACIACRGPVRSVRIFFRVPPARVGSLAVDEGSRTSIALGRVLLHDRFGLTPELVELPIGQDPHQTAADAVLVIGDRAMKPEIYTGFVENWDLGEEWFRQTQLPFVFAMWVGRASVTDPHLASRLEMARQQGLLRIPDICQREAVRYQLSYADCHDYLTRNLQFTLTPEAHRGLSLFQSKAIQLGLIHPQSRLEWVRSTVPTQPPVPWFGGDLYDHPKHSR
jgi:chorismate dehydratase